MSVITTGLKKKGAALKQGLYEARWTLLIVAVFSLLFLSSGNSVFAAADTTGKIKETGGKLLEQSRGIVMAIGGIGFVFSLIVGAAMISFGGFNKQWKSKGMEIVKWAAAGFLLLALVPLLLPMFLDVINGLGGEQVSNPLTDTTGGK